MFPSDVVDIDLARQALHKKSQSMGRATFREKGVAGMMLATLLFWFGFGEALGIANIALVSITMLFVLNLIDWKMVEKHVNWSVILMYGGAICLGEVMAESGAALWLAKQVFADSIQSAPIFLLVVAVLSTVVTTFMSNSAVIAVLLPPTLSMCDTYGIGPSLAAMAVILPSNFAFILPIATPASALAYSSRFITIGEMIRSGTLLSLIGMAVFGVVLFIYWPMIGFN
jgi:sodium-dependent dicarboxylate transporter 2/3/5